MELGISRIMTFGQSIVSFKLFFKLHFIPALAARRRGVEPEDVPRVGRSVEAAGSVGVPALQHPVRLGHQGHLHLRHELRRLPAGRADLSAAGEDVSL